MRYPRYRMAGMTIGSGVRANHLNEGSTYRYRMAGMTIGSGAIGSIHKWVIQARCKQAGMAWSERGESAMLRFRCVWTSGRWDERFAPPEAANAKKCSEWVIELAAQVPQRVCALRGGHKRAELIPSLAEQPQQRR